MLVGFTARVTVHEGRPHQKNGRIIFKVPAKKNKPRLGKDKDGEVFVATILAQDEVVQQRYSHWG